MRILGEYVALSERDAKQTVDRLHAVLDRDEVVHALDRMKRRRTIRLVKWMPAGLTGWGIHQ